MAQEPNKNNEHHDENESSTQITATVDRSIFSAAIGQINIHLTRRSCKELLHEKLAGACHADMVRVRQLVSDEDLCRAADRQALQTDANGRLVRRNKWLDYGFAAALLVLTLGLLLLAMYLMWHMPPNRGTLQQQLFVWSLATGSSLATVGVLSWLVWPQRTAKRAMRALGEVTTI
jgi:hypothetical protein